jgi:hypothetical protein
MEKKVTAIEWFAEQLGITSGTMLEKAKEMEKEQQFRFFIAGQISMEEGGKSFDQYYSKTYEK